MIPKYVTDNPTLLAHYHSSERYRQLLKTSNTTCKYLGAHIGERECTTCSGKGRWLKVYACSHPNHTETTLAECQKCQERVDIGN